MSLLCKRFLLTPGDPAGIGPDITIMAAQQAFAAELIAIADPDLLTERARQLQLPLQLESCDLNKPPTASAPGTLKIHPVTLNKKASAGKLDPANAQYVLNTLITAATLCQQQKAHGIITGPVNKAIMQQAGIDFIGHTEFFAQQCHVPQTIMLFVVNDLKVALATTHLPLAKVPAAITPDLLQRTLLLLHKELQRWFHLANPRIAVCGLNPHAGENGYLGCEEIEIITPAIAALRQKNLAITGPFPADTLFTPQHLIQTDAVLAMYHDQALPLIKHLGFNHAVNVTLGLPFIRTSVDHGTAISLAGTGKADPGSMLAAIHLALSLS